MAKLDKCEACKGSGYVYATIAGDKYIAVCTVCEGYGTFTRERPRKAQSTLEKFGSVNLDEYLE